MKSVFYVYKPRNEPSRVVEVPVIKIGRQYIYASQNPKDSHPYKIHRDGLRECSNYSAKQFFYTKDEAEDSLYVDTSGWRLADEVRGCHDAKKLKAIALILKGDRDG